MNWHLAYCLLTAHVVADFYLQNDAFCKEKTRTGFRGKNLYIHAIAVFALSWAACMDLGFALPAAVIAVLHLASDGAKSAAERKNKGNAFRFYSFIADQIAHIAVIIAVAWIWSGLWKEPGLFTGIHPKYAAAALAMLVLAKPANIFVGLLFGKYTISSQEQTKGNFRSGRLIGTMERWLILILVLLAQYEVIGFLVAAKSILRFSDTANGTEKSEYVLVGTLLSFLMAISAGAAISALP